MWEWRRRWMWPWQKRERERRACTALLGCDGLLGRMGWSRILSIMMRRFQKGMGLV
jgi:hypothetical protein